MGTTEARTGKVKFFNERKAYGFITDGITEKDIFFHVSGTLDSVRTDDFVAYEVEEGDRGQKAVNVKLIKIKTDEASDEKV